MLLLLAALTCTAPFDDGSFYKLEAAVKDSRIQGDVKFSYVTNDGLDLKAKMKVSRQEISGKSIVIEAGNGNMAIKAGADYWAEDRNYQGALAVSFNYDGTPPVEAVMTCELK